MINLNLRVLAGAIGRRPQLRADRIRRDTLTMLAAALVEDDDNSVRDALDNLVDAMKHDASDNEIDELVGDIEDLAGMGRAVMDLTPGDVRQLAAESAAAVEALPPVLRSVPGQRGGEAA